MASLIEPALPCRPLATLPKERGPTETVPGRKTETDRVPEGISEGFRSAESGGSLREAGSPMAGRVVPPSPKIHDGKRSRRKIETLAVWRRRAGSNRCIAVLQTAPLTTWVRRPAHIIVWARGERLAADAEKVRQRRSRFAQRLNVKESFWRSETLEGLIRSPRTIRKGERPTRSAVRTSSPLRSLRPCLG